MDGSLLRHPTELVSKHEPAARTRTEFVYKRRILPVEGKRLLLRLWDDVSIAIDHEKYECEVVGWGLKMHPDSIENVAKAMSRRFLELYSKAVADRLENDEKADWISILDKIDYASFCEDREPPQYMEGEIERTSPVYRVRWHDGTSENLDPSVAKSLQVFQVADTFAGYVKMSRSGKTRLIERVTFITQ